MQRFNKRIKVHGIKHQFNLVMIGKMNRLIKNYTPTFWLPFAFLKGMYHGDKKIPSIDVYARKEFEMEDGEVLAIDFYPKDFEVMACDSPIVMFVPGVFGMSSDQYSLKFCKLYYEQLGWRTCVFNRRGYGGMPIKGTRVVGFTSYDDIHCVVKRMSNMFPSSNIYLVGASMGAAGIQNYLASYSEENIVKGAVTISCPWNAHIVTNKVKKNPILRRGIHEYQLKIFKEQLEHDSFNKLLEQRQICKEEVLSTTDNQHFDEVCAAIGLGLPTKEHYYDALSTHEKVSRIRTPILSLNTNDDFLIPVDVIPFTEIENNPYFLHLQVTGGGHIEYFHGCKASYVVSCYLVGIPVLTRVSEEHRGHDSRRRGITDGF
jgi:predicted alpha/beta-fold hydrolase